MEVVWDTTRNEGCVLLGYTTISPGFLAGEI